MKKNSTGGFMLVSILMHLLHTLRGQNLTFTIEGSFPYVLYYGTMALYVICLLNHICSIVIRIHNNRKNGKGR